MIFEMCSAWGRSVDLLFRRRNSHDRLSDISTSYSETMLHVLVLARRLRSVQEIGSTNGLSTASDDSHSNPNRLILSH